MKTNFIIIVKLHIQHSKFKETFLKTKLHFAVYINTVVPIKTVYRQNYRLWQNLILNESKFMVSTKWANTIISDKTKTCIKGKNSLVWYNSVLEDFTAEEMRLSKSRYHYSNSYTTKYKQKMNKIISK